MTNASINLATHSEGLRTLRRQYLQASQYSLVIPCYTHLLLANNMSEKLLIMHFFFGDNNIITIDVFT